MAAKGDADLIRETIKKYGLHPQDCYIHQQKRYKVINRRGFKKIQAWEKIQIKFTIEYTNGVDACVIKASGGRSGEPLHLHRETYGEVSPRNSTFQYPHATAQSRSEGRLILEIAGLYQIGFVTEDEIDERYKTDQLAKDRKEKAQDSINATLKALNLDETIQTTPAQKTTGKESALKTTRKNK